MPGKSTIEWTDRTWNPTVGCTRVSAGCDHCYAFSLHDKRHAAKVNGTGPGLPGQYDKPFTEVQIFEERLEIPIRWKAPAMIFVNSISDLFHAEVPDEFIARVFGVMAVTQQHVFQILTKRPVRMKRLLSNDVFRERVRYWFHTRHNFARVAAKGPLPQYPEFLWPLPNVWMGVSVENQDAAFRIDYLVKTPAAVRFLSCEPLLGPLDLGQWLSPPDPHPSLPHCLGESLIDWVIAGGESGPDHRPCDPSWVRSIRDQCEDAAVPFFFKQWGGRTSKAGGRELVGRTYDEMPNPKG